MEDQCNLILRRFLHIAYNKLQVCLITSTASPHTANPPIKVAYDASSNIEAHLVMHQLQQAGIEARIEGEYLQGGVGELAAAGNLRVMVNEEDLKEAKLLIAEWEAMDPG
jgi:hypothetical protein